MGANLFLRRSPKDLGGFYPAACPPKSRRGGTKEGAMGANLFILGSNSKKIINKTYTYTSKN